MLKQVMVLSCVLTLLGCNSTKTVYPNECAVVSNIPVEKADPAWLEDPKTPIQPTEDQLRNGLTNADSLRIINKNNSQIWQEDRDIRREWTKYYNRLVQKGVIK